MVPAIDPKTGQPERDPVTREIKLVPKYNDETSVSLESWHDHIHGLVGAGHGFGGHMGKPEVAGVKCYDQYPFASY